ncbi:hypothetical protein EJ110_NYTH55616 [Nymphaea thermarum]|nr:hypothetical protein EJ110_NYTH55616 [Nymphaea thermarum]
MSFLGRQWIIRNAQNATIASACKGRFLLSFSITTIPERDPSSSITPPVDCPSSEMVSYLTNSCGLSTEVVTVICKKLGSRGRAHNARKVIDFLRESGFTDTHIRKAISRNPYVLVAKLEKTVMPKVRAFLDWGLSGADIGRIVAARSGIFHINFERKVAPVVDKLRDLVPQDERAVKSIKRFFLGSFLGPGLEKRIAINLATLRSHGVHERSLSVIVERWPELLGLNPSAFKKMAKKAYELWPNHRSIMFAHALYAVCSMSEPVWDAKLKMLKEFGWTEEDILTAFQKTPLFLTISASNLKRKLEFFVEELSYKSLEIAAVPLLLTFSLEKRVIPRLAVIKLLDSKEIFRRKKSFHTILHMKDEEFHKEFVLKHKDECPDVLKVYGNSINSTLLPRGCYGHREVLLELQQQAKWDPSPT